MSTPLRVSLFGCSGLGKQNHQRDMYAPAFAAHPGFSIVAATGPGSRELAGELGVPYRESLDPEETDVVSVCLPLEQRAEAVVGALRAGVHVLADKPVCTDPGEARRIAAAAAETDRVFLPAHHLRFAGSVRGAQAAVAAGRVGLPWSVHADFLAAGGEPVQDDELVNFAAYPVDVVHALTGQEVRRVHAYSTPDRVQSVLLLDHAHGMMSTITVGRAQSSRFVHRYRISGSHGMLIIDATRPRVEIDTPTGVRPAWHGVDTVAALVTELHDAITQHRPAAAGAGDAERVAGVLNAAAISLESGRPVDLPVEAQS